MKIGFIGFGDAASGIAKGLINERDVDIVIYSRNYEKTINYCNQMFGNTKNIRVFRTLAELLKNAYIFIVVVPCNQNTQVFEAIATCGFNCGFFLDCCSVTPYNKIDNSQKIEQIGGKYIDASIMETVHQFLHKTPIIVSGLWAKEVTEILNKYNMNIRAVGETPGRAATIKLCRSVFMKGVAALVVETDAISGKYGVQKEVFESLANSWNNNEFIEYTSKLMSAAQKHCHRQRREIEEVYQMEREAQLDGYMAKGTMSVYESLIEQFEEKIGSGVQEENMIYMNNDYWEEKIISYIRENKVSSTKIADCMNKTGAIFGSYPLIKGLHKVGKVEYIYAHSDSNWSIHEQLQHISENRVVFVDDINIRNRALFGELVSYYIFETKKAKAIVTRGLMRDIAELLEQKIPIWCGGITPEGCFNTKKEENVEIRRIIKENQAYYQDSIAICDDCGVVIIPKEKINQAMYENIVAIEEQEKIWFHCVQDLGWSTYETVCLKKYKK